MKYMDYQKTVIPFLQLSLTLAVLLFASLAHTPARAATIFYTINDRVNCGALTEGDQYVWNSETRVCTVADSSQVANAIAIIPLGVTVIIESAEPSIAYGFSVSGTLQLGIPAGPSITITSTGHISNYGELLIRQQTTNRGLIKNLESATTISISPQLNNRGLIQNQETLEVDGTIINESNGTIRNYSALTMLAAASLTNRGSIFNSGDFTTLNSFLNDPSGTFTNQAGGIVTFDWSTDNQGLIENQPTAVMSYIQAGTEFVNEGTINNSGIFNNDGVLSLDHPDAVFNNFLSSGQFFNDAEVKVLQGAFNNNAYVENRAYFFNSDRINNTGLLDSAALVENTGNFNNTGRFYNRCTASFLNTTGIFTGNAPEYDYCNETPIAQADAFTLDEDIGITIDVLTNDSDADGNLDPASTEALVLPGHGSLTNNFNGTFDYIPDLNVSGPDSFTYRVCDSGPDRDPATNTDDLCAEATVDLTVQPVNDAPSFIAGANLVNGLNAGAQLVPGWASGMSAGPANEAGQLLSFSTGTDKPELFAFQPAIDVASGDLTYVPATDAHGVAQVSVTLEDDGGTENGGVDKTVALMTITILSAPLLDFGDAPDPGYPTLSASDGARHELSGGLFLGTGIDAETDGHPSPNADGDDINNDDDEDGVTFNSSLTPAANTSIEVVASAQGLLNAWVDYNRDGDWNDAGEQVFTDVAVIAGPQNLDFSVPAGASDGQTHARFRINSGGGLAPGGYASDGEVEDYSVTIGERPDDIFTDGFEDTP